MGWGNWLRPGLNCDNFSTDEELDYLLRSDLRDRADVNWFSLEGEEGSDCSVNVGSEIPLRGGHKNYFMYNGDTEYSGYIIPKSDIPGDLVD